jgi:hypothetical protein
MKFTQNRIYIKPTKNEVISRSVMLVLYRYFLYLGLSRGHCRGLKHFSCWQRILKAGPTAIVYDLNAIQWGSSMMQQHGLL